MLIRGKHFQWDVYDCFVRRLIRLDSETNIHMRVISSACKQHRRIKMAIFLVSFYPLSTVFLNCRVDGVGELTQKWATDIYNYCRANILTWVITRLNSRMLLAHLQLWRYLAIWTSASFTNPKTFASPRRGQMGANAPSPTVNRRQNRSRYLRKSDEQYAGRNCGQQRLSVQISKLL